ncbi:MAG TPA: sensor histidine kinase, partial [Telluria sp.]|nr:sensor histidine kinase [Telluria sp.]
MTGDAWVERMLFAAPLLMLYAVACVFFAHYLCRAWPLTRQNRASILAVFCVSASMASAGWTGLGNAWNALLQSAGHGIAMNATLKVWMFVLGVVLYALTVLGNYL